MNLTSNFNSTSSLVNLGFSILPPAINTFRFFNKKQSHNLMSLSIRMVNTSALSEQCAKYDRSKKENFAEFHRQ